MSRIKSLREMVSTSRDPLQPGSEVAQQYMRFVIHCRWQIPLHYGRKRTLQPLPAQFIERAKTPAQGFQIDHILPSLDVSFIAEWLSRSAARMG